MAKLINLQMSTVGCVAVTLLMFGSCIFAYPDPLKCEGIKCPPMSQITCPEDSQLREYIDISSAETTNDTAEIVEELLHECCVARKCACKLCNIPSCQNDSMVIYEIIPETQIPGHCCGAYECRAEPNCTETHDPEGYWLTDCQRCKCVYGERICHRTCDEIMPNPTTTYCKSKNLNRFFSNGETWKDGCSECECINGEEKCLMPFCRSLNCPQKQVTIQGGCCPICWPEGDEDYYEAEDTENHEHSSLAPLEPLQPLAPLAPEIIVPRLPDTTTTTSTTTSTTTPKPTPSPSTAAPPPCVVSEDPSATYAVYPEVVEVVHPASEHNVLYIIIGIETILLVVLYFYIWHLRARKHSYNTVSNLDDNFNNCPKTSLKIEKMGDLI